MIQDYYNALDDFVDEAEAIEDKIGKYQTMKSEDLYMPKSFPEHKALHYKTEFSSTCQLTGIDNEIIEVIDERKDRFIRFVGNFDEYKKGHVNMFQTVTEELIDEIINKLAHELDRGSNDFVDLIFRK